MDLLGFMSSKHVCVTCANKNSKTADLIWAKMMPFSTDLFLVLRSLKGARQIFVDVPKTREGNDTSENISIWSRWKLLQALGIW